MSDAQARSGANESKGVDRPGPDAVGTIVKRYRKRDKQHVFGLRVRAYGERHWVPLGTEREGWNDVRAADRRDEIVALIRRGVWRPPNAFELDPREKDPELHEFASDWLNRYRRTVRPRSAESAEYLLRRHLLPSLHQYRLSEIDYALLSSYVAKKLEQNEEIATARDAGVTRSDRHGRARRVLSPRTINMTLELLALILSDAVRRGLIPANPAADPELRLKASRRKGNFLEADELLAVIDASGAIDSKVGERTLTRGDLARRLRAAGRTWNDVAQELDVAQSTAIWLAARERCANWTSATSTSPTGPSTCATRRPRPAYAG